MKIEFTEERELLSGAIVKPGDVLEVADSDGQMFIDNGVAKLAPAETKKSK